MRELFNWFWIPFAFAFCAWVLYNYVVGFVLVWVLWSSIYVSMLLMLFGMESEPAQTTAVWIMGTVTAVAILAVLVMLSRAWFQGWRERRSADG